MGNQEITARLAGIIVRDLGANLTLEDLFGVERLDTILGFDSMVLMQWVAAIEREFRITIPPEKLRLDFLVDLPELIHFLSRTSEDEAGPSHP
jgi:acyl carrier protein